MKNNQPEIVKILSLIKDNHEKFALTHSEVICYAKAIALGLEQSSN